MSFRNLRTLVSPNSLEGVIEERFLVNYRVDPDRISAILPAPFTPTLVDGHAIAGICLIQLRLRPSWLPHRFAIRSNNGAHRIAVTLPDGSDAVYIPRRDSSSLLNTIAGGRLFPGAHHMATITPKHDGDRVGIDLLSRDGQTHVAVSGTVTDQLPNTSVFGSVAEVSAFFERGSLGYSDTRKGRTFDGLELRARNWSVVPLAVDRAESSFFDDRSVFPDGSATLDNALLMRGIDHTWHRHPSLTATTSETASVS